MQKIFCYIGAVQVDHRPRDSRRAGRIRFSFCILQRDQQCNQAQAKDHSGVKWASRQKYSSDLLDDFSF
jgi:hypothetical protein